MDINDQYRFTDKEVEKSITLPYNSIESNRQIAVAVLNNQTNLLLKMKIKCNATAIEAFRIFSQNATVN